MAEVATSETSSDTDRDFDPSADMMVHDFDDEQTMDDEENMSGESCSNELDDLEKEGEMPLEDLLAMYGYGHDSLQESRSSSEEEILSNQDLTLDKDEVARDLRIQDDNEKVTDVNELLDSVDMPSEIPSATGMLLRSNNQHGSSDDEDSEDLDYHPSEEEWKKMVQVGSSFQAAVPEGLCKYGDAPAYENEDRLLWDPTQLDDPPVEQYLKEVQTQNMAAITQGVQAVPRGSHVRDDEQALYLLLQCGHNTEEALRRRKMQAVPPSDPMSLWSEEECRNFESGLRHYGKDFYLVQLNKVRTRSVGELVQFYYLWKKTERHDIFAAKTRLEKRKYGLHPGVTDYMDRFLDDQENPTPPMYERASSPGLHSLLYEDHKRHLHKHFDEGFGPHDPISHFLLRPELNTAAPTTVSIDTSPKQSQSLENVVHIANFNPATLPEMANETLPEIQEDHTPNYIEPSPKKLKLDHELVLNNLHHDSSTENFTPGGIVSEAVNCVERESSNVALSISSLTSVHDTSNRNLVTDSILQAVSEPVAQ